MLYEHVRYDGNGTPLSSTFMDYLLPTAADVPLVEYDHVETPSERIGGYKGVGEGGASCSPAAVVNAVADALSPFDVTITSQPLGPSQILELIDGRRLDSLTPCVRERLGREPAEEVEVLLLGAGRRCRHRRGRDLEAGGAS